MLLNGLCPSDSNVTWNHWYGVFCTPWSFMNELYINIILCIFMFLMASSVYILLIMCMCVASCYI